MGMVLVSESNIVEALVSDRLENSKKIKWSSIELVAYKNTLS